MEELLAKIAEIDDEEDLNIQIRNATWGDSSLELEAEVSIYGPETLGTWDVRCENVLAYALYRDCMFSLELTDEHPLLWKFTGKNGSAYFLGAPKDSDACVGVLYQAHRQATGGWIDFGSAVNNLVGLSRMLSDGNGLLARGPLRLLEVYKQAILPYGVDVSILPDPAESLGARSRGLQQSAVKVLLLGCSYVIGSGWSARRL
jgi:hypothetical protein